MGAKDTWITMKYRRICLVLFAILASIHCEESWSEHFEYFDGMYIFFIFYVYLHTLLMMLTIMSPFKSLALYLIKLPYIKYNIKRVAKRVDFITFCHFMAGFCWQKLIV